LTLDIMFKDQEIYELFKSKNLINNQLIATLYGVNTEDILSVVYFEPAHAIKATFKRLIPSGAPGDTDIYGAQQHGPLLDLEWEV
ncbi:MAG: DUF4387 domain-containing protein, partial [Termitinemataceae bacterium]